MIDEEEGNPKTEHSIGAYVVSAAKCAFNDAEEANSQASLAYAAALMKKKNDRMLEKIRQIISGE